MTAALTIPHPVTGKPLPPFLSAEAAAELVGISAEKVARSCARGDLPALSHEVGEPWRIPTAALLRVLGFEVDQPASPSAEV